MLVRKVRTAQAVYREGGAHAMLRALAGRLGLATLLVFETQLEEPVTLVTPRLRARFDFLVTDEVDAYVSHRGPDVSREQALARLAAGDRCFAAWSDDRVVSSRWVVRGVLREQALAFAFLLPPDHAYVYDAWTSPDERGYNLSPAALSRLGARLAEEGCARLVSVIHATNEPSIRSARRAGHRARGVIAYHGSRAVRFGGGRPRLSVRAGVARAGRREPGAAAPYVEARPETPGDAAAAG